MLKKIALVTGISCIIATCSLNLEKNDLKIDFEGSRNEQIQKND